MYKRILVVLVLAIMSLHAVSESSIRQTMDSRVKKVLKVLKNKSLSQHQKETKCLQAMNGLFDYSIMAKISLGKKWSSLSDSQKRQFTRAFERKIKHVYVSKLRLYDNQKVVLKDVKKVKADRIRVETRIIGSSEVYKVTYKFYRKKNSSQWYIYDVNIAGVSIVRRYRKQFSDFLKTKSFQQLLHSL